jgi:two-component system sensor histidine kinase HydH
LPPTKIFSLTRWFSIVAALSIAVTSVITAYALSRFLTDRMLERDAQITMEFIQSLARIQNADRLFTAQEEVNSGTDIGEFFLHISSMPDVLRANIFDTRSRILWSSNPELTGRTFRDNPELDEALEGKLAVQFGLVGEGQPKPEHLRLQDAVYFVENYVPVYDHASNRVIGVVEIYRVPTQLFETIHDGHKLIWLAASFGGALLFLTLFWLVRRSDNLIRSQNQRLLETEKMAVIVEMASAVAHSIRNPLASIRTSAELQLAGAAPDTAEALSDIISEVDRVEALVRDLLTYSRPVGDGSTVAEVRDVVMKTLEGFSRDLDRQRVKLRLQVADDLPPVRGDSALLVQVGNSLVANALESMAQEGRLTISARPTPDGQYVELNIQDSGEGIAPERLQEVFKPFFTTKARGLGVGLTLARKIVERFDGEISLASQPGEGTMATVRLKAVH